VRITATHAEHRHPECVTRPAFAAPESTRAPRARLPEVPKPGDPGDCRRRPDRDRQVDLADRAGRARWAERSSTPTPCSCIGGWTSAPPSSPSANAPRHTPPPARRPGRHRGGQRRGIPAGRPARPHRDPRPRRRADPRRAGPGSMCARPWTTSTSHRPTQPSGPGWEDRLTLEGPSPVCSVLGQLDPSCGSPRIEPRNGRRVIRALEVIELTGGRSAPPAHERAVADPDGHRVDPGPLSWLDARIETRRTRDVGRRSARPKSGTCSTQGLAAGGPPDRDRLCPGHRPATQGTLTEAEAIASTAQATRRFARRQESWFRPDPRIRWLPADAPDLLDRALAVSAAAQGGRAAARRGLDARQWLTCTGWPSPRDTGRRTTSCSSPTPTVDPTSPPTTFAPTGRPPGRCRWRRGHPRRPHRLAGDPEVRALADQAAWFMDYRNADGSVAEMCGNGTRVFAAYLRREGLETSRDFAIATRAGLKTGAHTPTGMPSTSAPGASRSPIRRPRDRFHSRRPRSMALPDLPGLRVDMGNPHTVVVLPPMSPWATSTSAWPRDVPRHPSCGHERRVRPDPRAGPHRDAGARARGGGDPIMRHRCVRGCRRRPAGGRGRPTTTGTGPSTCPVAGSP
jgi:hypothetical protein